MNSDSIKEVLEHIGAEKVRVFRRNVQCACFFAEYRPGHSAGSDHADSMGISIAPEGTSLVHCFACKFKGTLQMAVRFLSEYTGEDFGKLLQRIGEIESDDITAVADAVPDYDTPARRIEEEDVVLPETLLDSYMPGTHPRILHRGLTLDTCKKWGSLWDAEKERVIFPVRRSDGKLVGGVGRTVVDHPIRYWNYWDFQKSRYLFGMNHMGDGPSVIVVEGLLDTVAVWQELQKQNDGHFYTVVGLLGSESSMYQTRKLATTFDEAILFFDNDSAGWEGQTKLARGLSKFMVVRGVRYPIPDGDPMELVKEGYDVVHLVKESSLLF